MWRRNLYISWFTQIISLSGFGLMLPFIPFYIQELGVGDPDELRLWTGVLSSAPALTMGVMAPIWGLIADRWGRKLMILRAMAAGAVVLSLMSLTRTVEQVLVLRLVQGLFAGTVTASAALVAAGTPEDRMSYALGFLSSSNFIGVSLGPLIGGLLADRFGYNITFLAGGVLLGIGCLLVLALLTEPGELSGNPATAAARRDPEPVTGGKRSRIRDVFNTAVPGFFVLILLLRFVRTLPTSFLPIIVQEMRGRIEGSGTVTGFLSAGLGTVTAIAALTITRLGDRYPRLPLITMFLALSAFLTVPLYFLHRLTSFSVMLIISSYFQGGIEPLIQADLSARTHHGNRGLLFGMQTTVANIGWFIAPLAGSWLSIEFGLAAIFPALSGMLLLTTLVSLSMHLKSGPVHFRRILQR